MGGDKGVASSFPWQFIKLKHEGHLSGIEGRNAQEVPTVFVLGWCTGFAALLSSACENSQRNLLFHVCQGHNINFTVVICTGSYQLCQMALCSLQRHV